MNILSAYLADAVTGWRPPTWAPWIARFIPGARLRWCGVVPDNVQQAAFLVSRAHRLRLDECAAGIFDLVTDGHSSDVQRITDSIQIMQYPAVYVKPVEGGGKLRYRIRVIDTALHSSRAQRVFTDDPRNGYTKVGPATLMVILTDPSSVTLLAKKEHNK